MKTQIMVIAVIVFLMPEITFGQVVNQTYNNKNYTVLPVDLLYFSAENKDNEVLINWAFGSELINIIELEKSFNARDFVSIAGFKNEETSRGNVYSFLDKTPFKNTDNLTFNTVYYRLKQIDANHIFEYSKVIMVKELNEIGGNNSTPKSYQFTPKSVVAPQAFSIVNVAGKVMMNGQLRDTDALDIRQLPAGFYCLNIQSVKFRFLKN